MSRGFRLSLVMSLVCVLAGTTALQAAPAELATAHAGAAGIEWRPVVAEAGLVLTVSGPQGLYLRQEFAPGQAAAFSVFDEGGQLRPAGSYVYELRAVPQIDAAARAEMDAAREAGAGTEAKAGKVIEAQSGAFAIRGGAIVMGGEEPQPGRPAGSGPRLSTKDFVIADDLIVNGGSASACIGFDCINGEAFGFDTLKLKENNTRIKFEDTSTGTFPSTDWQLTANDSTSGGANKFSIEDITGAKVPFTLTAGASTNSIFVDSTGRVGFRTSTPVLDLHVATSNTPALRLEQNSSGGFTAQTWDVAGNEANFFVRDVTGGSRLSFRIRPGAPTSSIDIAADGDVGIGTASPDEKLHVFEDVNANTLAVVENANTGADAAGVVRALSDVTTVNFQAHGSGRTITRFGEALGGWGELLHASGNGLIVGTLGAQPLILGANNTNVLEITPTGTVLHLGSQVHPDYVFEPDYELESIEEHAAFMWKNKHLPAVGPGRYTEDGRAIYELGESRAGMLEELEKAHIYIDQLHGTIQLLEVRLGDKDDAVRALAAELASLKSVVEDLRDAR